MGSLQDQLLKVGLIDEKKIDQAKQEKQAKRAQRQQTRKQGKRVAKKTTSKKPFPNKTNHSSGSNTKANRHESDLAAAYHAKQKAEKQDKEFQKQQRMAEMERRRLRNLQLDRITQDKCLNDEKAELSRYFNYMGKIRRVMVTEEQLAAVNSGEIVIVVHRSRPALLDKETASKFAEVAPDLLPDILGEEPDGKDWDGQYEGFEVPDDLRW